MSETSLRIATRKSPLALWQARSVAHRLEALHLGLRCELVAMSTEGDRILDAPLARVGGKGLFVKELERGLLEGSADVAVHSMKDVPIELPQGLHVAVILERGDPRDAFVSNHFADLEALPQGARVGTSSLRRRCQLKALRPDLDVADLRGNVNTRLQRLDAQRFDAVILAAAGLIRLGFEARIRALLDPAIVLPAIGQGAIGVECRAGDARVEALIAPLDHAVTKRRVAAERAVNARFGGSCQVPIAAYAEYAEGRLHLRAVVGDPDGDRVLRAEARAAEEDAEILGLGLAELLIDGGAAEILAPLGLSVRGVSRES